MYVPRFHKLVDAEKANPQSADPLSTFDEACGNTQPIHILTAEKAAAFICSTMPTDEEMERLENEGAFILRATPKIY